MDKTVQIEVYVTKPFSRAAKKIWSDDEQKALKAHIAQNPEEGTALGHNLFKIRYATEGSGKRGGARVIYYLASDDGIIILLAAYKKADKDDLDQKQYKEIGRVAAEILEIIKAENDNG